MNGILAFDTLFGFVLAVHPVLGGCVIDRVLVLLSVMLHTFIAKCDEAFSPQIVLDVESDSYIMIDLFNIISWDFKIA